MLFVVDCVLLVVRGLVFDVCGLLFVDWRSAFAFCRALWCWLFDVYCLVVIVRGLLFVACSVFFCLLFIGRW